MLTLIAQLALAAAAPAGSSATVEKPNAAAPPAEVSAPAATDPLPAAPWWEKITVTMDGEGTQKSCKYESSTRSEKPDDCAGLDASLDSGESVDPAPASELMTLTFERRFSPGSKAPADAQLKPGEILLGRKVMALAIDPSGKVKSCDIVITSGDVPPDYSCKDASSERFADAGKGMAADRQGFFTILIYGHSEHVVSREEPNLRRV